MRHRDLLSVPWKRGVCVNALLRWRFAFAVNSAQRCVGSVHWAHSLCTGDERAHQNATAAFAAAGWVAVLSFAPHRVERVSRFPFPGHQHVCAHMCLWQQSCPAGAAAAARGRSVLGEVITLMDFEGFPPASSVAVCLFVGRTGGFCDVIALVCAVWPRINASWVRRA